MAPARILFAVVQTAAIFVVSTEATAWSTVRTENQIGVDWQFTSDDAQIKLMRLSPQFQMS